MIKNGMMSLSLVKNSGRKLSPQSDVRVGDTGEGHVMTKSNGEKKRRWTTRSTRRSTATCYVKTPIPPSQHKSTPREWPKPMMVHAATPTSSSDHLFEPSSQYAEWEENIMEECRRNLVKLECNLFHFIKPYEVMAEMFQLLSEDWSGIVYIPPTKGLRVAPLTSPLTTSHARTYTSTSESTSANSHSSSPIISNTSSPTTSNSSSHTNLSASPSAISLSSSHTSSTASLSTIISASSHMRSHEDRRRKCSWWPRPRYIFRGLRRLFRLSPVTSPLTTFHARTYTSTSASSSANSLSSSPTTSNTSSHTNVSASPSAISLSSSHTSSTASLCTIISASSHMRSHEGRRRKCSCWPRPRCIFRGLRRLFRLSPVTSPLTTFHARTYTSTSARTSGNSHSSPPSISNTSSPTSSPTSSNTRSPTSSNTSSHTCSHTSPLSSSITPPMPPIPAPMPAPTPATSLEHLPAEQENEDRRTKYSCWPRSGYIFRGLRRLFRRKKV
ncbi:uncharacterized protein [Periplaneta americana]|uniref:uncharacterized protein n=1 Tax=Periplaneta americana TaxID=6978 RepID=UPI0037E96ACF